MTEDQAKEPNQTLGYISGQLHGVAVLLRIGAEPVLQQKRAEVGELLDDVLGFNPPELPGWEEGLKSVTDMLRPSP